MESILNFSLATTTSTKAPRPSPYGCNKNASCGCGKSDVSLASSRIIGGEDAIEHSWPMIVSLRINNTDTHVCGATIVSRSFVLTAAHCLRSISTLIPNVITVSAGVTNRSDPSQIIRTVVQTYSHPQYNSSSASRRHDIALLRLEKPFDFDATNRLVPTCIHRRNSTVLSHGYLANGTRLAIIGWGALRYGIDIVPQMLQQAEILAIDNEHPLCLDVIYDDKLQFCAGLFQGGKGESNERKKHNMLFNDEK
jgi:hypothetical protein